MLNALIKHQRLVLIAALAISVCHVSASEIRDWNKMTFIDVNAMDWEEMWTGLKETSRGKKLYSNDQGAFMVYLEHDHGWDSLNKSRHFHDFHEWGYVLNGNFLIYEFVNGEQQSGSLYNMKAGTWMSRPPFSIHGHRADAMKHQRVTPGAVQLAFSEGGKSYSLDPTNKWYSPSWKEVPQFTHPHFQDTATPQGMEWEDDANLPGASVKWLSDHGEDGFRAKLYYVPPGWQYTGKAKTTYFGKAQQFYYVLFGDLTVLSQESPNGPVKKTAVQKDFFINRPPKSLWTWGEGKLSSKGAMWLEVTYAQGARVGNGPIEKPIILPSK
jgi:hypothetical protein